MLAGHGLDVPHRSGRGNIGQSGVSRIAHISSFRASKTLGHFPHAIRWVWKTGEDMVLMTRCLESHACV